MFVTVLVAGGFFIAKGSMTGEDLAIYALYINIFINPVNVLCGMPWRRPSPCG